MTQKGHMHEDDVLIVNQSGWGVGRNAYPKCTLYKVRKTIGGGTTPITIVSPVAGNLDRARALMHEGGGKRKKKKKTKSKSVTKKKATKKKTTKKSGQKKKKKAMRKKKTSYFPKCI